MPKKTLQFGSVRRKMMPRELIQTPEKMIKAFLSLEQRKGVKLSHLALNPFPPSCFFNRKINLAPSLDPRILLWVQASNKSTSLECSRRSFNLSIDRKAYSKRISECLDRPLKESHECPILLNRNNYKSQTYLPSQKQTASRLLNCSRISNTMQQARP